MHLIVGDAETFWSSTHSLTKMSPIEYAMHPETEIISFSFKVDGGPTQVFFGEDEIRAFADTLPWSDSLFVAHNCPFDSMIVQWRLGYRPKMWGCTLSMARPHHGRVLPKLSLAALVQYHGIGVKNDAILVQTKGKHLRDFTPAEIASMRVYNGDDTEQCHGLFKIYRPVTNNREMWTIDSNIRMMVDDVFELDQPILREALRREKAAKRKTLLALSEQLGVAINDPDEAAEFVRSELMSTPKFKRLLENLGIDVPMKPSPKDENKMIPALAKTDPGLAELLESEDEVVAAAAAARLQMKSTLLETRIEAFLRTAAVRDGKLPIPAKYWGAHTGRDSGDLYNALNMPRIARDKNDKIIPKRTNALRLSLCAPRRGPKPKVILAADLSGIEMRINHFLWKVKYSTARWRQDPTADIYKPTAAQYYRIDESQVNKDQRQFGKVLQLACGFQVGPPKFKAFAWGQFRLSISDDEAAAGVYGWRDMTPEISDRNDGGWARCQRALDYIIAGREMGIDPWGLTHTCKDGIVLPDGNLIRYPDLRQVVDEGTGRTAYKYGRGRHTKYVYGGATDENIVQALGRIILMDNVREFWRRTGLWTALRVYDEPVYVVDENEAEGLLKELLSIMRTPPKWWPELVVWSEGDTAESYGLAK